MLIGRWRHVLLGMNGSERQYEAGCEQGCLKDQQGNLRDGGGRAEERLDEHRGAQHRHHAPCGSKGADHMDGDEDGAAVTYAGQDAGKDVDLAREGVTEEACSDEPRKREAQNAQGRREEEQPLNRGQIVPTDKGDDEERGNLRNSDQVVGVDPDTIVEAQDAGRSKESRIGERSHQKRGKTATSGKGDSRLRDGLSNVPYVHGNPFARVTNTAATMLRQGGGAGTKQLGTTPPPIITWLPGRPRPRCAPPTWRRRFCRRACQQWHHDRLPGQRPGWDTTRRSSRRHRCRQHRGLR